MPIRLKDIANDLNLSKITISKVLRGQTDVSAETKARVLKRMQELNYRPNISARALRTGQTYALGMVVPSLADPAIAQVMTGVNEVVRPDGYSVVLTSADGDIEMEEREVEFHLSRQVDALLLCLRSDVAEIPQVLAKTPVPVVLVGHAPARFTGLSVGIREAEVGKMAAEYLLERRCKRLAYLRGPRTPVADLRFAGFLEALRSAGQSLRQEWVIETQPGEAGYRNGFEAAKRLAAGRVRPDGIVAYTDVLAVGIRDGLLAASVDIPRQVQLTGSGNVTEVCETGIALTSIDLPWKEAGRRAAKLALRMIENKGEGTALRSVLLSPCIVQRASTREAE